LLLHAKNRSGETGLVILDHLSLRTTRVSTDQQGQRRLGLDAQREAVARFRRICRPISLAVRKAESETRSGCGYDASMQVALYARGFVDDERQDVENQLLTLRRYCERSGLLSIEAEYVDWTSGEDGNCPEFQRLLEDACKSRFDQVVFWSLDQLSRSGRNATLRCLDQLTSCRISWRCIADSCFDPGGPYSRSPGEIPAALARQERRRISEGTKAGPSRALRAGKTLGRPRVPVNVAKVRSLQASGVGLHRVAKATGRGLSSIVRARARQQAEAGLSPL
jgi:DNA invertase Pin-like site-specific DNA recombinase